MRLSHLLLLKRTKSKFQAYGEFESNTRFEVYAELEAV